MLPAEEWWAIMALYGEQVWPAQVILYLAAAAVALVVFLRPGAMANTLMRAYLALVFGWVSIVFFILIGRDLAGNYVFGTLFGVVAVLFAVDLVRQRMDFRPPTEAVMRYVVWGIAVLVFAYPAISLALGHTFPRTIVPGAYPCPTTALALLMLTLALPRADKIAYVLLLFWAVPLPPVIQISQYGVYEDAIMFGVGLYAVVMLIMHWRKRHLSGQQHAPSA